ncbi:hypothetical protein PG990_006721 [Apiospora arundinis]
MLLPPSHDLNRDLRHGAGLSTLEKAVIYLSLEGQSLSWQSAGRPDPSPPPSPVHLFHGILILGSGRKAPYVSIRILCALKWRCNSPGIHSVTRDNVVLRVKGSPLKGQLLKQEVCELIAKALEAPKPQNTYPTGPASWETCQRVTGFLAPLRSWQSASRKIEEPQHSPLKLRMDATSGNL